MCREAVVDGRLKSRNSFFGVGSRFKLKILTNREGKKRSVVVEGREEEGW